MALLALCLSSDLQVWVVTVNHGLRPEAADEAAMVAQFCAERDIAHDTLTLSGLTPGPGVAARARDARYTAISEWAHQRGVPVVLLGHTQDDQAETVLMRLARGSGADGLAAMAPARDWNGLLWMRPLLEMTRADLRSWLTERAILWIDDPTNDDLTQDRVRMRRAMPGLAELGLTRERLAATARTMTRQSAVLHDAGNALAAKALRHGTLGEIYLDPAALRAALPDTALRVLADALLEVSSARYRPRLDALDQLLAALTADGFSGATLSGCTLSPQQDRIAVCREPAAVPPVRVLVGRQMWDTRWQIETTETADLWVAPLGKVGLQAATAALRSMPTPPPIDWRAAPSAAKRAVPALFTQQRAAPATLIAVPSAGLFHSDAARSVTILPPKPGKVRHHEPE